MKIFQEESTIKSNPDFAAITLKAQVAEFIKTTVDVAYISTILLPRAG